MSNRRTWKDGRYKYRRKKRLFSNFQGYWSNEFRKNQEPNDEWSTMKRFVYNNTINPMNPSTTTMTTTTTTVTTTTTTTTKKRRFHSSKSKRRKRKKLIRNYNTTWNAPQQLPFFSKPKKKPKPKVTTPPKSSSIEFEVPHICMVQDYLSKPSSEPTRCLFELRRIPVNDKNGNELKFYLVPEEVFDACRKLDPTFEVNYCKLKDDDDECLLMEVRGNNVMKFYNMVYKIEQHFMLEVKKTSKTVSNDLNYFSIMVFPSKKLCKIIDESGLTEDQINNESGKKAGVIKQQLELEIAAFKFIDTKTYFEYREIKPVESDEKKKRWLTLYFSCVIDLNAAKREFFMKHKDYPNVGLFNL
jgi:hypothetical protein